MSMFPTYKGTGNTWVYHRSISQYWLPLYLMWTNITEFSGDPLWCTRVLMGNVVLIWVTKWLTPHKSHPLYYSKYTKISVFMFWDQCTSLYLQMYHHRPSMQSHHQNREIYSSRGIRLWNVYGQLGKGVRLFCNTTAGVLPLCSPTKTQSGGLLQAFYQSCDTGSKPVRWKECRL